ncbi:hypothetical protein CLU79DRAFT_759018 [Phycomyces nitens]|nr:hypothetical protein CLU79DRAFT_759018 [Phycomyces nitens]
MCGTFARAMHGQRMLDTSGILAQPVKQLCHTDSGAFQYTLYDDSAYTRHYLLVKPFKKGKTTLVF